MRGGEYTFTGDEGTNESLQIIWRCDRTYVRRSKFTPQISTNNMAMRPYVRTSLQIYPSNSHKLQSYATAEKTDRLDISFPLPVLRLCF
jgi:hypothetical protein